MAAEKEWLIGRVLPDRRKDASREMTPHLMGTAERGKARSDQRWFLRTEKRFFRQRIAFRADSEK
jgi:hypothetical protein